MISLVLKNLNEHPLPAAFKPPGAYILLTGSDLGLVDNLVNPEYQCELTSITLILIAGGL